VLIRTSFLVVSAFLLGLLAREAEREQLAGLAARRELSTRIEDLTGFLNNILHSIPSGVVVVGADRRVELCNRRASELLGIAAEELVDRPLDVVPRLAPLARAMESAGAPGGAPAPRLEVSVENPAGRPVELGLGLSPVPSAAGQPPATCLVFQDITPIKEYQRRLIEQERLAVAGRLAGGVAHEFGNLLGGLKAHAEFALQDGRPAELQEALSIVARNIDRALLIVRNLLAFSRKSPPRVEACDVARVLSDALLLVAPDCARQRIAVERDLGASLAVAGDPLQIQQAFLNLLINARQAMPGGGTLRVAAARDGGRVRVAVADTGPGVAPEARPRLFEPFFTTKTGEDGGPPGSGLGLAITRDIVAAHGGTIEVENAPGKGAVFTLWLPASA
jgi:PAS domain S-box-containing protein